MPCARRADWIVVAAAVVLCAPGCGDDSGRGNNNNCPRDSLDCSCDESLPGCEDVVNKEGECECWDGLGGDQDPDPPITGTELRCSPLLYRAFAPDVDSDGDCVPDLLSVGFKIRAVPVTIDN